MIYNNTASLILRIGISGMIMYYGWFKLLNLLSENPSFADPIGIGELPTLVLAVIAEFFCPIFIILGLKTRLATIFPIATMLVAALIVHADDPWTKREHSLLFLIGFIAIFLLGSGKYSLDWRMRR